MFIGLILFQEYIQIAHAKEKQMLLKKAEEDKVSTCLPQLFCPIPKIKIRVLVFYKTLDDVHVQLSSNHTNCKQRDRKCISKHLPCNNIVINKA